MKKLLKITSCLALALGFAISFSANAQAQPQPVITDIDRLIGMKEMSGLVASRRQPGIFWTHNDSGNAARIYAFRYANAEFTMVGSYSLTGPKVGNVDWEDVSIGPGPDGLDWIYVADIGNNGQKRINSGSGALRIHRFREPTVSPTATNSPLLRVSLSSTDIETLFFAYAGSTNFNAEAFSLDPRSGDAFILTKRKRTDPRRPSKSYLFRFDSSVWGPYWLKESAIAPSSIRKFEPLALGEIPAPGDMVTAMDISPAGDRVAVLTYSTVSLYDTHGGPIGLETFYAPLASAPFRESQAEAVTFGRDGLVYVGSENSRRVRSFEWR